ncbi:hypothetical protein [Flavobacterium sp.]|uniref:hypothetical protein n=1 Tax=Flavobacterium sp. TaxID=239 RepID=UPI002C656FD3|nr:hypothetical protein [Flavobacterium sp.]HQA75283.1 hypothetical protein [Flavobacterium sp.]
MKKIQYFIILFCFSFCFSQNEKQNIFIFIPEKPSIKIGNDTLNFQRFEINFNSKHHKSLELIIDKLGNLQKKISLKSNISKLVYLNYESINSNNNPILVNPKDIKNFLTHDEIINNINFDNFINIINDFNVYVINSDYNLEDFFIAKKVKIEKYNGL